jgi:hypothetical protein
MNRIEQSIAVPVRRFVGPLQLAAGSAIALCGLALLTARIVPLI